MDGLFPTIFHGKRSELREKYRIASASSVEKIATLLPCLGAKSNNT
jgi:hypothetical protein